MRYLISGILKKEIATTKQRLYLPEKYSMTCLLTVMESLVSVYFLYLYIK